MDKNEFARRYKLTRGNGSLEVDAWLEHTVLPDFKGEGQGFEMPTIKYLTLADITDILRSKGFNVSDYSNHQGSFIYFKDDPKDF
jgi:hypothetical protein